MSIDRRSLRDFCRDLAHAALLLFGLAAAAECRRGGQVVEPVDLEGDELAREAYELWLRSEVELP